MLLGNWLPFIPAGLRYGTVPGNAIMVRAKPASTANIGSLATLLIGQRGFFKVVVLFSRVTAIVIHLSGIAIVPPPLEWVALSLCNTPYCAKQQV